MEEVAWVLALALLSSSSVTYAQTVSGRSPPLAAGADLRAVSSSAAVFREDESGRIRRAWGLAVRAAGASPEARALWFIERFGRLLAIAPGVRLHHDRTTRAHGHDVVRFSRVAFGGQVLGSSVIVRLGGDVVDYVALDRVAALSTPQAALDLEAARALALAAIDEGDRVRSAARGAIQVDGTLAAIAVVDVAGVHLHQRWRVVIDRSGVRYARPLSLHADGRVFPHNPVTDMDMTFDLELPSLTSRDRLTGRYFRVQSCNAGARGCEPVQYAEANVDGHFLYDADDPSYEDPFSEVNAYYHANIVAEHFRDAHGFTWRCGAESLMRVFVNYTEAPETPHDNAAYSPSGGGECGFMFFGQGRLRDFAYDSDVIYHEFGHAVVDLSAELGFFVTDRLGLAYDPGSINEGYADYVAATVSGDPRMAEYFQDTGHGGEGALRNLDNDFVCPDDLVGEVHFDGRIFAGMGWDLRVALGAEKSDPLMYGLISAIEMTPSLSDAAEVLLATAAAMVTDGTLTAADAVIVEAIARGRGLIDCERVSPLDGDVTRLGYSGSSQLTGNVGRNVAPVQYRLDIPADAEALHIAITDLTAEAGDYTIHWRTGGPLRFVASRRPPLLSHGTLRPGEVIDRGTDPPLPRCETMYFGIVTENLAAVQQTVYQLHANLSTSGGSASCAALADAGGPAADGGVASADGGVMGGTSGGACGCRAGGASGARWPLWLAGLAWLVRDRRRRV